MAHFKIEKLSFSYKNASEKILNDINLDINEGEFILLCGKSGCGKTTLLRHLKPSLTPHGERTGKILYGSNDLFSLDSRAEAQEIGYVLQNPESAIVTDRVWHELAFGLENIGIPSDTIRLRTAEMAAFFGIEQWYSMPTEALSGGQKQLLSLASIMLMQPSVLILDEPTSQLDPIASNAFLNMVKRLNRELGVTVIISEHRLDEVMPMADRVAIMENGRLLCCLPPKRIGSTVKSNSDLSLSLPAPIRICSALGADDEDCPITVRDGRRFLADYMKNKTPYSVLPIQKPRSDQSVITAEKLWFKYEKNSPYILKDLNIDIKKGDIYAIVGGNGAGKSTLLSLLGGLETPYSGKIKHNGNRVKKGESASKNGVNVYTLPQSPSALFLQDSVLDNLLTLVKGENAKIQATEMAEKMELSALLDRHPYDLSVGEQQRVALAMILLADPKILLLDEPTKGLDSAFKQKLGKLLKDLTASGITVVMSSHDLDFCAENATTCAMLFDGDIISTSTPTDFFGSNSFYTTNACHMSRNIFNGTVTASEVVASCKKSG